MDDSHHMSRVDIGGIDLERPGVQPQRFAIISGPLAQEGCLHRPAQLAALRGAGGERAVTLLVATAAAAMAQGIARHRFVEAIGHAQASANGGCTEPSAAGTPGVTAPRPLLRA